MQIEKLTRAHRRVAFDCGEETLNRFLREFARKNAQENLGVTYVLVPAPGDPTILGYYTLVMTEIAVELMPPENRPPLPTIPAALLGRLATDINHRSSGLGKLLVADCLHRVVRLSEEIGVHLIAVDALNAKARAFYEQHFELQALADDPNHLYLPVKTAEGISAFNNRTLKEITILKGQTKAIYSVAFSTDGRTLSSGSEGGAVKLWQVGP